MSRYHQRARALRLYALLLKCYPREYRQCFGSQMLQTFKDHYTDVMECDEQSTLRFWSALLSDEGKGILREYFTLLKARIDMKRGWVSQGIIFGVLFGIIQIGYNLINNLAPASQTLNALLSASLLLAVLVFTFLPGYLAARHSGRMKTGAYAGLCASLVGVLIGMSALFVITLAFTDIIRQNAFMIDDFHRSGLTSMDQFILQDALGAALIGTCASLLAGVFLGLLGGYLGEKQRRETITA